MNFKNKILESAKRTIELESKSIYNLLNYLDDDFVKAVECIYNSNGKVVITGIGKSAAIANKIVSSMNSTGTNATFMHSREAIHGDIGIIKPNDSIMYISKSGTSDEISSLLPYLKKLKEERVAVKDKRTREIIFKNGMTREEIFALTESMIDSGEKMDFTFMSDYVADKHSTGGVGDKVSIILGPLMAAAGLAIPMISGRSLGHTGGTLDKLETIPGYRTNISLDEFKRNVNDIGISMIGQTEEICPADRKMYALRDVTGTVASIPLICGSIMSKKIAEGIQGLVMDIKIGNGAFMNTIEEGKELAALIQDIAENFNIQSDIAVSYTHLTLPTKRIV